MKKIRGRVWKFGDNVNTDNLSPAQYIPYGIGEVAKHCLEAIRPEFSQSVKKGDVILGGDNFGTGSSRETAVRALKELGIALVIAKSFARIYYRNSMDIALPAIICPELFDLTDDGDIILADIYKGEIINERKRKTFKNDPIPKVMMEILQTGGLINYVLKEKW